jgi:hypothetical protein
MQPKPPCYLTGASAKSGLPARYERHRIDPLTRRTTSRSCRDRRMPRRAGRAIDPVPSAIKADLYVSGMASGILLSVKPAPCIPAVCGGSPAVGAGALAVGFDPGDPPLSDVDRDGCCIRLSDAAPQAKKFAAVHAVPEWGGILGGGGSGCSGGYDTSSESRGMVVWIGWRRALPVPPGEVGVRPHEPDAVGLSGASAFGAVAADRTEHLVAIRTIPLVQAGSGEAGPCGRIASVTQ